MRLMADDFVRLRNAYADLDHAREYHGTLKRLAAEGRQG